MRIGCLPSRVPQLLGGCFSFRQMSDVLLVEGVSGTVHHSRWRLGFGGDFRFAEGQVDDLLPVLSRCAHAYLIDAASGELHEFAVADGPIAVEVVAELLTSNGQCKFAEVRPLNRKVTCGPCASGWKHPQLKPALQLLHAHFQALQQLERHHGGGPQLSVLFRERIQPVIGLRLKDRHLVTVNCCGCDDFEHP